MNQRASRVAAHILEPKGPDSYVHWGFFDTIMEQKEYKTFRAWIEPFTPLRVPLIFNLRRDHPPMRDTMPTVSFTAMKDGSREDYLLLRDLERPYHLATADRVIDELRGQGDACLAGYAVTRLQHALQAATLDSARYMGLDHEIGSIAEGKLADLVLLNANPLDDVRHTTDIHTVIKNGSVYDSERKSP